MPPPRRPGPRPSRVATSRCSWTVHRCRPTQWSGVQQFTCDYRVQLERDQEFGNSEIIDQDYEVPSVNGSIDIKPRNATRPLSQGSCRSLARPTSWRSWVRSSRRSCRSTSSSTAPSRRLGPEDPVRAGCSAERPGLLGSRPAEDHRLDQLRVRGRRPEGLQGRSRLSEPPRLISFGWEWFPPPGRDQRSPWCRRVTAPGASSLR
jgi:hypothetical protein